MTKLYGAIEAGGTKFVCAVADEALSIVSRLSIPTSSPKETMTKVFSFFNAHQVSSIGIASFGPIDVNRDSPTYGYITDTPKPGWQNYDFLGEMKRHFDLPYAWTTDVNGAAYGELKRGAAVGKKSCVYLTVGTGIGGGVVIDGRVITGFGHPEIGHITLKRYPKDDYASHCPFHNDCLEGLASGPAIEERKGMKAYALSSTDPIWKMEAYYLAQACLDLTLVLSPEMIIFGGGVSKQSQLFPLIRASFASQMKGYVKTPDLNKYIVHAKLGDDAGITGCWLLAQKALKGNS